MCLVFCGLYSSSCFIVLFRNLPLLLFGRVLGGVSTVRMPVKARNAHAFISILFLVYPFFLFRGLAHILSSRDRHTRHGAVVHSIQMHIRKRHRSRS